VPWLEAMAFSDLQGSGYFAATLYNRRRSGNYEATVVVSERWMMVKIKEDQKDASPTPGTLTDRNV